MSRACINVEHGWDVKVGEIDPKSQAGFRDVPMTETLWHEVDAHIERTGRSGNDLLFGRNESAPFTDRNMRKRARRVGDSGAHPDRLPRVPAQLFELPRRRRCQ